MQRKHVAVCLWCKWGGGYNPPLVCLEPHHNPSGGVPYASDFNRHGQCERFVPSLATRVLTVLQIRKLPKRPEQKDEVT